MSETPEGPMLSPDGRFLWDGYAWRSLSPDGRSYWDGAGWRPVAGQAAFPPQQPSGPSTPQWATPPDPASEPPRGRSTGPLLLLVAGIFVLLTTLVVIVIQVADDGTTANDSTAATPPRPQTEGADADHWHVAVGVNICGTFVPPLSDVDHDNDGIHTHTDGIAHVHPNTVSAAGANATFGRWLTTVGADVSSSEMELPGLSRMMNGRQCPDGKAGVVRAMRWSSAAPGAPGIIVKGDPGDILLKDGELITVAFLPADAEIPKPPATTHLGAYSGPS